MRRHVVAAALLLPLVACSTNNKIDTSKSPENQPVKEAVASAGSVEDSVAPELQLNKEGVYFDYNRSQIKSEFEKIIKQQADFLRGHRNDIVTLEGNCDERGSAEYNLALGDRRAVNVERQMQALGVSKNQIKTVSNGKESPRLNCHEEKCWKENRRVDFIHKLN